MTRMCTAVPRQISRSRFVNAFEGQHTQFVFNPLWNVEPVEAIVHEPSQAGITW